MNDGGEFEHVFHEIYLPEMELIAKKIMMQMHHFLMDRSNMHIAYCILYVAYHDILRENLRIFIPKQILKTKFC